MGLARSFKDGTGEHYRLSAMFTDAGTVKGKLTTSWRSRRYGRCSSGTITWHAKRSG
jgi:hypothetical protein